MQQVCVGGEVSVRCPMSVRSDLTHFQLEYLNETFRIYIWYGWDYAREIFSRQGAPIIFDAPKRGFSVILELLLQFLSQNVQIFRMCSSIHGKKIVGNRILIQGPQIFSGGVKNGQNFELFYYLTQELQIWAVERLWSPDFISLEKFWIGPPVLAPRAPKGQNFKIFVFRRRTFKFLLYTFFGALISYQLKNFGLEPPFGPLGPQKGKILKFLFLNVGPSKFYFILILVP